MSKNNNLGKIIAAIGIGSLLISGAFFSFYKAFNDYLDNFVVGITDFLSQYGIYLSIGNFWLVLGVILVFLIIIIAISSD